MSKPTTSPKKSRSTAPAVDLETVKTDGTQDDAAVTTSVASDPSGLRAPDGNNTGPTDADGSAADQDLPGEGHAKTDADAATASVDLSTEPSQGVADGAGANAGSEHLEDTMAGAVNSLLVASGAATVEQLLHLSNLGRQFRETLHELVHEGLVSEFYIGSTTPVDAFRDLAEKQRLALAPPGLEPGSMVAVNGDSLLKTGATLMEAFADAELDEIAAELNVPKSWLHSEDVFQERFPLTYSMVKPFTLSNSQPTLTIVSARDGFRRGGISHTKAAQSHPLLSLSPEQVEAMLSEPLLTVEVV
ncbi:hypothetical protein FB593_102502 [Rhizobium sp. SJZ105]|uniref:hypothetical protein n=1 Tax=Rhizobium sp. SJZ105 TaxID=2572678 RepID=UPI0011A1D6B8|nr:hypothetical protein [Rhizobium sp. SJZ105]TWC85650.1 hypothetical protein FB593_102502 [Rhizobium sp. SJZ105]